MTKVISRVSVEFESKNGLSLLDYSISCKEQPFMIHSFWSLGIADPFPDESTLMDQKSQQLGKERFTLSKNVYPAFINFEINTDTPFMIFLPSRILLVKMMRSCMGC